MEYNTLNTRYRILRVVVFMVMAVLLGRLAYMQLFSDISSDITRSEVEYPMRGEVLDRNGEYLVKSRVCYDVMLVSSKLPKEGFDTVRLLNILKITPEKLKRELKRAASAPRAPHLVVGYLSQEEKLMLDEGGFEGFYTRYRTAREYPRKIGGNLLGYVNEVNERDVRRWNYYSVGDYIGVGGVESAYEVELRGEKGINYRVYDAHGALKGPYRGGEADQLPVKGKQLTATIDGRLQEFAEKLMEGRVGAVVAIEPSTGEILVMVSAPTYNPDLLVGRQRGNYYMDLINDVRRPLYNRAVVSPFPPGSTFKLLQGLVGLQEGVLHPSDTHHCYDGYSYGVGSARRTLGCHIHASPLDLRSAVAESCNAYFCEVFEDILRNKANGSTRNNLQRWMEYVSSFGFGQVLDSDFNGEKGGVIPSPALYDKKYPSGWNWGTAISCAIGQGEIGCTPLQMANFAATIANRGYYYTPHIIKAVEGEEDIDPRFKERHYAMIDSINYIPIIEGMWRSVNVKGTSRRAYVKGLDICGKTGTVQNPHSADHSTFLSFAPKDNPKIAISVYVEHGGGGGAIAAPIASLIEEMYLTGEISRPEMLEYVENYKIDYSNYREAQRKLNAKENLDPEFLMDTYK